MTPRHLELGALVGFSLAAVWAATREAPATATGPEDAPFEVLDAIPDRVAFVATARVRKLRESKLGNALAAGGRELHGLGPIEDVCGFDPTTEIRDVAIALPSGPNDAEIGIVATGDFDANAIAACATEVVKRRGGDPRATRLGSFTAVRDARAGALGEVAVRDGGPVLLAGGGFLRELVDTADGKATSVRRHANHAELRRTVEASGTVVASWVAPRGWFADLAGPEAAKLSPLASVSSVAVSLDFVPELRARGVIRCEQPEACADVGDFMDRFRTDDAAPWALREIDLDLEDDEVLGIIQDGARLLIALKVPPEIAVRAVDLAIARATL